MRVRDRDGDLFRGAALRLRVECLECETGDLRPSWTAKARPANEVEFIPGLTGQVPQASAAVTAQGHTP